LIDQYESLYACRDIVDYRPMFNEAMYAASRGGTGVEFKIGTRQYSYTNFLLPGGHGRIEAHREMIEIDLDTVARDFYQALARELFQKRMRPFVPAVQMGSLKPDWCLPALSALEEADLYAREATGDTTKHIHPFVQRWRALGLTVAECGRVISESRL